MVTLRLFHTANPFRPIETRVVDQTAVSIGRDPGADWCIEDAACELSRRHCEVSVASGRLRVKDTSANGVFVGDKRRRIGRDNEVDLSAGEPIYLGQFMITADVASAPANDHSPAMSLDAPFHSPILHEPELSPAAFEVLSVWPVAQAEPAPRARLPDAVLLEAFCEGAGLDPSMFLSEDPAQVMRRAGAVYQQAVLGLSDLMSERTSLKSALRMDRTTVSAADNNPFKWADAHRVAVDLLRSNSGPFLSGGVAVNNSFQDLKKHLLCLIAGSRAAVDATIQELRPDAIGKDTTSKLFERKAEMSWREYQKRHERIATEARENADSVINQAFRSGYERQVRKLDGLATLS
jgi:predicted component of type VI protein secretion system